MDFIEVYMSYQNNLRSRVILFTTQRSRSSELSGGAIVHSGELSIINSSLVDNVAGADGVAVLSFGTLTILRGAAFQNNTLTCPLGEYGYDVDTKVRKMLNTALSTYSMWSLDLPRTRKIVSF